MRQLFFFSVVMLFIITNTTAQQRQKDSLLLVNLPKEISDKYCHISGFYNKWTAVRGSNCRWGMIDENGNEILPAIYRELDYEKGILVKALLENTVLYWIRQNDKLIPLKYEQVELSADSFLLVESGGFWGVIDTKGQGIALLNYHSIVSTGDFWRVQKDNQYGILAHSGKEVLKSEYQGVYAWKNQTFIIKEKDKFQLLNAQKQPISRIYDQIWEPSLAKAYLEVKLGDKWGLIDPSGAEIVAPKYNEIQLIVGNLFAADGQLINTNGLSQKMEKRLLCGDKLIIKASPEDKWGIIDMQGNWQLKPEFDDVFVINSTAIAVKHAEEWAIYNVPSGQSAKNTYSRLSLLRGTNYLLATQNGKVGIVDAQGRMLIPCQYETIETHGKGIFKATNKEGSVVFLNTNGKSCNCN